MDPKRLLIPTGWALLRDKTICEEPFGPQVAANLDLSDDKSTGIIAKALFASLSSHCELGGMPSAIDTDDLILLIAGGALVFVGDHVNALHVFH